MRAAGYPLCFFGVEVERGMALVRAAAERSPSFAWAWSSLGMLEMLQGSDLAFAEACADRALRLSPRDPLAFRNLITKSRVFEETGRHAEAVEIARDGQRMRPGLAVLHVIETRNLVVLGRMEEAREAARRLLDWIPGFRAAPFAMHHRKFRGYHWDTERFTETLVAAGLPE